MISEILTSNVVNITELKRTPVELANHRETCVLNNGKPCFYTVSSERMAELLEVEKKYEDALEKIDSCETWLESRYYALREGDAKKADQYLTMVAKALNKIYFDPKEDDQ